MNGFPDISSIKLINLDKALQLCLIASHLTPKDASLWRHVVLVGKVADVDDDLGLLIGCTLNPKP